MKAFVHITFLFLCLAPALGESLKLEQIREAVFKGKLPEAPSANDPDFPIYVLIKGYLQDQKSDHKKVIETLEPLLRKQIFEGRVPEGGKSSPLRAYAVWRDLGYIILARSYYETGLIEHSLKYLEGFPSASPFAEVAAVQRTWAFFKLKDYEKANREIELLKNSSTEGAKRLLREVELQEAFVRLKQGDFAGALVITERLDFTGRPSLESLRHKIRAQALFQKYEKALASDFDTRIGFLNGAVDAIERVTPKYRNVDYAYFAAEAHWQLASQLRVKDIARYSAAVADNLKKADGHLGPWATRSIQEKKTLLTEDALFLSAVVLWESKKFDVAIPRLLSTIDLYPATEYREDIHQLIGDHYYEGGQFQKALPHYSLLTKSGKGDKGAYGLYKAAWCFYNLNEKFKALRHLQRLGMHYRKDTESANEAGSLAKEAEKDTLLLLAELLPVKEAIQEIELLQYEGEDWFRIREELAARYGKLGGNAEAVEVWKSLLDHSRHHPRADEWLTQLLQSHLNAAQRKEISASLAKYRLPDRLPAFDGPLMKMAVKLQLTLHREAYKTDDAEVWEATDALYGVIAGYLPELPVGDFWYFGAQRKQKKGDSWAAMAWYQKAAEVKGYENAEDSGVTILGIAQTLLGQLSLEKKKDVESYRRLSEILAWALVYFEGKPADKAAAEAQYLEALYHAGDLTRGKEHILANLQRTDRGFWLNVLHFNRFLYGSKHWELLFEVTHQALEKGAEPPAEVKEKLGVSRQEAAFEQAFTLEKTPEGRPQARAWYERCAEVARDPQVRLKAWHNLLVTWDAIKEAGSLARDYERWAALKDGVPAKPDNEDVPLLFQIHTRGAAAYRSIHDHSSRSHGLLRAAEWAGSQEVRADLQWEALTGFAAAYDIEAYLEHRAKLLGRPGVFNDERIAADARFLFLFGRPAEALERVKPLLKKKLVSVEILLRDVVWSDPNLASWITGNESLLAKSEPLQSFWARRSAAKLDGEISLRDASAPSRSLAQVTPAQITPVEDAMGQLKERLGQVSQAIRGDVEDRKRIKAYFATPHPQVKVHGLCKLPDVSLTTKTLLERLRAPEIATPQWGDFLKKLETKISEIEVGMRKELADCQAKTREISLFEPLKDVPSLLCTEKGCPAPAQPPPTEVRELLTRSPQGIRRIYDLILMGAWITAASEAHSLSDKDEKRLALSLLRLAVADVAAAVDILQDIKSDLWKPKAGELLERVRLSHLGEPGPFKWTLVDKGEKRD